MTAEPCHMGSYMLKNKFQGLRAWNEKSSLHFRLCLSKDVPVSDASLNAQSNSWRIGVRLFKS